MFARLTQIVTLAGTNDSFSCAAAGQASHAKGKATSAASRSSDSLRLVRMSVSLSGPPSLY